MDIMKISCPYQLNVEPILLQDLAKCNGVLDNSKRQGYDVVLLHFGDIEVFDIKMTSLARDFIYLIEITHSKHYQFWSASTTASSQMFLMLLKGAPSWDRPRDLGIL